MDKSYTKKSVTTGAPNNALNMFLLKPIRPRTFITNNATIDTAKLYWKRRENIPISRKNFIVYGRPENRTHEIKISIANVGIEWESPVIWDTTRVL